ncbi:helix-turn-helix domain-containing protein [Streptomyces sp. NPDC057456]|uniref:helix-turn-helix domain-containing protein n=1 Tax=Streptomyces sp. NPDC057456 TaxID=3346139 RepID=UPI00369552B9
MRSRSPGQSRRRTAGNRLNGDELQKKAEALGDTSQRAISLRAGVPESVLSRLLDHTRSPSLETLISLADAYDSPIEALIIRPDGTPMQIPSQAARTAAAVG